MMAVVLLLAVSLLHLAEAKGSGTPMFAQTGNDLFLGINQPVALDEGNDFIWKFNGSKNIVKYDGSKTRIHKSYTGRAVFSMQNHSLHLRNVQRNDSGCYEAQVSGDNDKSVAEYNVTVLDPVSPVWLTVNSFSSCNLTVTCRTVDSHVNSTFRCDNQTCLLEREERSEATTYPSSINVYLERGFVFCNHSNAVNWKQDKTEIKSFCEPSPVRNGAIEIVTWASGVGAASLLVTALCLFLVIKYLRTNYGNTVPQDIDLAQTLDHNPTEDASDLSPTSTYCLVEFHSRPVESTNTKNTPLPETVYAQVNKSAKTSCRPAAERPQPVPRADKH